MDGRGLPRPTTPGRHVHLTPTFSCFKGDKDAKLIDMKPLFSDAFATLLREALPLSSSFACATPPGAGLAALTETLRRTPNIPAVLVIFPTPIALEAFCHDAFAFAPDASVVHPFPMIDLSEDDPEAITARGALISRLHNPHSDVPQVLIPTCIQALLQPTPDPFHIHAQAQSLEVGATADLESLLGWLSDAGYHREREVYCTGHFALKGGIVDVWPPAQQAPIRIEFFGDEVESIRRFDSQSQRSTHTCSAISLPPIRLSDAPPVYLHHHLLNATRLVWIQPDEIACESERFIRNTETAPEEFPTLQPSVFAQNPTFQQIFVGEPAPPDYPFVSLPFAPINGLAMADIKHHDPEFMATQRHQILAASRALYQSHHTVIHLCLDTEGTREHIQHEVDATQDVFDCRVAPLSGGFTLLQTASPIPLAQWLSQSDLYGHAKRPTLRYLPQEPDEATPLPSVPSTPSAPTTPEPLATTSIGSEPIQPGDLVVHLEYGIGRFQGIETRESKGRSVECLCIRYANDAKLYVPITNAHFVSRYQGPRDAPIKLHSLGGRRWANEKAHASTAVEKLAAQMLETQARRQQLQGLAFESTTPFLHEFEAAFPYAETPGQAACIQQVKNDLYSTHPMDRLVCGDAGYGKTEIAIRAAFICAMQGRQVAILVPTTVLAQQHYDTFCDRMAAYPITLALHSRFCTPKQREAALEGIASGGVDIIIGTHGLLQPTVRFKNLGLVIIDEEQRFGVRHKEFLKTIRLMVDVLTLSATPIPRTLYLGIVGARDLSLLQTPPRERVATETRVVRQSDELVQQAILAEVSRGGQVFYLHNRVLTINWVHEHLKSLMPHLRIGIGHGQMPAAQIEQVMHDFAAGRYDVLLSTTIIESGIDIPRANTILVDRADRFGIADLYQLRGRVGRGGIKAYAYFMIPPDSYIQPDARERLKALQQHAGLSAGVALAMRDLGIRGAGNLLGAEQSGHIATIGFTLYCQLLRQAIARLKGQRPPLSVHVDVTLPFLDNDPLVLSPDAAATLPQTYIPEPSRRLEFYRNLSECATEDALAELQADLTDRFGTPPEPLQRLFALARCRILAAQRGITRIELDETNQLFLFRQGRPLKTSNGTLPHPGGNTTDERIACIARIIQTIALR